MTSIVIYFIISYYKRTCLYNKYTLCDKIWHLFCHTSSFWDIIVQKSLKYHTWSNQLYTCGAVALFNFRDPDLCISHLERIKSELGLPMVYHSNLLLARSYAAKKEYAKSLNYFDEELKYYPLSALASGLRLSVLHLAEAGEKGISEEKTRFEVLMKMRGLGKDDLSKLIRNQQLDDAPLKTRDDE